MHGAARGVPNGQADGVQAQLKRSPYGLKQSGRNWFECFSSHLFELNFQVTPNVQGQGPAS